MSVRDDIYRRLGNDWRALGDLGLGDGRRLYAPARSLGHLVESRYDDRHGHLLWRRKPGRALHPKEGSSDV